jgi:hypothetical protein
MVCTMSGVVACVEKPMNRILPALHAQYRETNTLQSYEVPPAGPSAAYIQVFELRNESNQRLSIHPLDL